MKQMQNAQQQQQKLEDNQDSEENWGSWRNNNYRKDITPEKDCSSSEKVLSVKAPEFIPGMSPDSPGSNTMTDQIKKITVSDITTRFEDAGLNHQALRNEEEEAPDVDKVIQNLKNRSQLKKQESETSKTNLKNKNRGNIGDILKKPLSKFDTSSPPKGNFKSWRNYNNISAKPAPEGMQYQKPKYQAKTVSPNDGGANEFTQNPEQQ